MKIRTRSKATTDTDDDNDVAGDGKMKRGLSISSLCEDF